MNTFSTLGLNAELIQALDQLGFSEPTPVQRQVIHAWLSGGERDLIALAQTGTGKTAAFGLPLIQTINPQSHTPQGLILCPTRELCLQVSKDIVALARCTPGIKPVAVYGGANILLQIKEVKRGANIVVATPGRLLDLIRRREIDISAIRALVLDEADEMLQMGFQDDLNAILAETPKDKRTALFSATMPQEVATIAQNYMRSPLEITVGDRNTGAENVEHLYYLVAPRNRYQAMKRIADLNPDMYAIIFCRTRQETREIAERLITDGYNAEALHGELSQAQRDQVMERFRAMSLRLLVATDVAARGLDVKELTHVINYNLPDEAANYTHRSGRTGRAGRAGISVSLVSGYERHRIQELERRIKRKFRREQVPSGQEVCERQLLHRVAAMKQVEINPELREKFLPRIGEALAEMSREELIARLLSVEFNRLLDYYRGAIDLNLRETEEKSRFKEARGGKTGGVLGPGRMARLHLNIGKRDGLTTKRLLAELNAALNSAPIKLGNIDILRSSTIIEAESRHTETIIQALTLRPVTGKMISVQVEPAPAGGRPTGRPWEPHQHKYVKPKSKAQDRRPRQWNQTTARPI
ncbi:MAG: DEAD/DEAH box helicase [Desulfobacteraceae bacterium]|nr:DEAD/DEAH box helicase [Desulfobacteraceae bacterium]